MTSPVFPAVPHRSWEQLDAALEQVRSAPSDNGTVELVQRRPREDEREVLTAAELQPLVGVVGDDYAGRPNPRTSDGRAHPEAELTLMCTHSIRAVAGDHRAAWTPAGDQLFVDFDLSRTNLPTGSRLSIGEAIIEVTAKPHNGCAKFGKRFGIDAARWVNSDDELRLRGINAIVVQPGTVRPGDTIAKLAEAPGA